MTSSKSARLETRKRSNSRWFCILGLVIFVWHTSRSVPLVEESSCPQVEPFRPATNPILDKRYSEYLTSETYRHEALNRFTSAIRFPTISFDMMRGEGVQVDPNLHQPFLKLHEHFKVSYPLIHSRLERFVVNEFSLLFRWKGKNEKLKPIMFMAHQDVVPIDPSTANEWYYDPFSGFVDGTHVWGRGACDTKMTLTSVLEASESLLQAGFEPERTILISFGHDEEISGYNGIKQIVKFIHEELQIPENGVEFVLDEGMSISKVKSPIVTEKKDYLIAQVGVAEKGYMDVNVTVTIKKGGHASIAPPHTGIGILSEVITQLEANPSQPDLQSNNPVLGFCNCIVEHTDIFSEYQRFLVQKWEWFKPILLQVFASDPFLKASTTTSQAVDVIHGGVKVNALPQFQYALINMRIAPHETVEIVSERIMSLIRPVAEEHSLDLFSEINSHSVSDFESKGAIYLSFNDALQPSPISSSDSETFKKFAGVVKHLFGTETIVAPALMTANTDTKFVWNLTDNIYRFIPSIMEGTEGIHTVNENIRIDSFIKSIRFYHELIRSFNE
jgi:Gly-Xaa carboxypeptidase